MPDENVIPMSSIVYTKVNICFFNLTLNKFVGNTCRVQTRRATDNKENWFFDISKLPGEDIIYARYADYDPKINKEDKDLYLCFEFV